MRAPSPIFVHERSYQGLLGLVHRSRIRTLTKIIRSLNGPIAGTLGDFGCSNGFVMQCMQALSLPAPDWHYVGLDHKEELLALGRQKELVNTSFELVDLNKVSNSGPRFDIVTCLETLEHVGNYRNAVKNLFLACKPGGRIIISVPYEKGLPGLAKYLVRKIIRRNPYGDFFANKSELAYVRALLLGHSIESYRNPPAAGWGPHLGFDNHIFERFLLSQLVAKEECELESRQSSLFGFNVFYIFARKH